MGSDTTINQLYQSLQDLKYYIDTQPAPGLLLRGQLVKELPGYKKAEDILLVVETIHIKEQEADKSDEVSDDKNTSRQ